MSQNNQTIINTDLANKKIVVTREFNAPLEDVWKAWTERNILDEWWAPKPWKARTKSMDFKPGGRWLYAMVGPNGEEHWARMDFKSIDAKKSYTGQDSFCDENGNIFSDPPGMFWENKFSESGGVTKVEVILTFASEEDLNKMIEMGFKEGFTMAHGNLDELLAKKKVSS